MGANQMMGFGLHLRLGFVGNHPIGANTFVRFYCTRPCPSLAAKPNHMPTLKNSKPAAQKFPSPLYRAAGAVSVSHTFFLSLSSLGRPLPYSLTCLPRYQVVLLWDSAVNATLLIILIRKPCFNITLHQTHMSGRSSTTTSPDSRVLSEHDQLHSRKLTFTSTPVLESHQYLVSRLVVVISRIYTTRDGCWKIRITHPGQYGCRYYLVERDW